VLMLESIHPLLNFVLVRPGLVLFIFLGTGGWGTLGKADIAVRAWSRGLYLTLAFLWCLAFMGWINTWTILIWLFLGSLFFFKNLALGSFWNRPPWPWLLCLPLLAMLFVRTSAPPYFVDFLSYHLSMAMDLFEKGGWRPNPDHHFMLIASTAVPESFMGLGYLLGDDITMALMNMGLVVVLMFQLHEFSKKLDLPHLSWQMVVLLLSTPIFAHCVVYGKTEVFLMVVAVDVLLRMHDDLSVPPHPFWLGVALGVLGMAKLSLLPVAAFLALLALWRSKGARNTILLILGGVLPVCFWVGRNLLLHESMPLHPIVINPAEVPEVFHQGISSWSSRAEPLSWMDSLSHCVELMAGLSTKYFRPNLLFLAVLWLLILGIWQKKFARVLLMLLAMGYWIWWIRDYRFMTATLRLTFVPIFMALVFLLPCLRGCKWKEWVFTSILLCGCALYLFQEALILPGLRYHLGQQSQAEYYGKIPVEIAVLAETIQKTHPELPLVVLSELSGVVKGASVIRENLPVHPVLRPRHIYLFDRTVEVRRCEQLEEMVGHGQAKLLGTWGRAKGVLVLDATESSSLF